MTLSACWPTNHHARDPLLHEVLCADARRLLMCCSCCCHDPACTRACVLLQLGLKALHKLRVEHGGSAGAVAASGFNVTSFLAAAQEAVPALASDFNHLAMRVRRQLSCVSDEMRCRLLHDSNGYMSSTDLAAVHGQHHAAIVDARPVGQLRGASS